MKLFGILTAATIAVASIFPASAATLTVYSPQGDQRAIWIKERAKAAGHDITILNAGGGELFDRLMAEKNNPQADVVLGMVDTSMALMKKAALFQAYSPVWATELPAGYNDVDGMVHKFWQTPIVLGYYPDTLGELTPPKSWLDLTKDQYKGKYVIGSTAAQTTRIYLAGMLARFLDENGDVTPAGWDFMTKLYNNAIVVNDGDALLQAYKSKEATITLNWLGGALKQSQDLGLPIKIIDTEGGTPFISEGVAIVAGTKHLVEAKAFIDWFGSKEVMAAYAEKFGQVPALPAALARSPAKVQELAKIVKPQPINWDAIAPKLDAWLQRIELDIR
ncbi:extracellular solute-binding protein [Agrobacterium sp. NPDC089420]|uniref:extracellular solute-binding protein n=1 Tax=Agrobacterium sp. NPDC089420 TaxID=3363918 RepID=UPI003850DFB7